MHNVRWIATTITIFVTSMSSKAHATGSVCEKPEQSIDLTDTDHRAKNKDFDATGIIPCAQEQGEKLGSCKIEIARGADGTATAVVTFENGFKRRLYFEGRTFVYGNPTMSGSGKDVEWDLNENLYFIRIDDQRFEIPDWMLFGSSLPRVSEASTEGKPAIAASDSGSEEDAKITSEIDLAAGKKHFKKNCRACHGPKAQGMASFPKLAGKPEDYLIKRLKQYRAGEKLGPNTPLMAPPAEDLTDNDISNIVGYIGTFK